jgi:CheY-like chemotaxis protein
MSTVIAPGADMSWGHKPDFIANLSHELRRPLNSLLVLAEQLQDNADGNLTERQVQYAGLIRASGQDLVVLLDDIVDLARAEANILTLDIGELSLAELRDGMARMFVPVAAEQGMGFRLELDETLPASIQTDPRRLRQVLRNLLSNAFRFSSRGDVVLRMEPRVDGWDLAHERLTAAEAVLAISVVDSGVQAECDESGLGLSISRALVGALGGELTIESVPGKGSRSTLFLPLRAAAVPADVPGSVSEPEPDAALGVSRVLLVDNDPRNSFAMTVVLERMGIDVIDAQSGPEALAMLDERPDIDLVLVDIVMPGMNGYQVVAEIRKRPRRADLPIIAMTGNAMPGERQRCLAAGASDYLPKPVDAARLRTMLAGWGPESRRLAVGAA